MKRFLVMAAVVIVAFSGVSFATVADPSDSVLVAYQLTPAQSAQFNPTDSTVSPFWSLIDSTHDYWNLLPSTSTYLNDGAGFANDSDAQMLMKAAYDSNGVYFYFKVIDNVWDADAGWQFDNIDLYVDNQSSFAITSADPTTEFTQAELTYTCQQRWIPVGGSSAPTTIGLNYYDNTQTAWSLTTVDLTTDPQKIKLVKLDSVTRVIEMFIPWANYGVGGVSGGMGPVGTQFAISGGYNDADYGSFNGCIRILHNGDPWESDQNYWGDLELGPMLGGETKIKSVHQSQHGSSVVAAKIVKTEYFTLAGRKIETLAIGSKNQYRTLIRRDRLDNGKIMNSIIHN